LRTSKKKSLAEQPAIPQKSFQQCFQNWGRKKERKKEKKKIGAEN